MMCNLETSILITSQKWSSIVRGTLYNYIHAGYLKLIVGKNLKLELSNLFCLIRILNSFLLDRCSVLSDKQINPPPPPPQL